MNPAIESTASKPALAGPKSPDAIFALPSFCVLPWMHLDINPQGTAKICCRAAGPLKAQDGAIMSLYHSTLEEMWNSPYMRAVRRAMCAGAPLKECAGCYADEKATGTSHRKRALEKWLSVEIKASILDSTVNGGIARAAPVFLQVNPGNLCNLKCRMCSCTFSSQIEKDPVHAAWAPHVERYKGSSVCWDDGGCALLNPCAPGITSCGLVVDSSCQPPVINIRQTASVGFNVPAALDLTGLTFEVLECDGPLRVEIAGQVVFDGPPAKRLELALDNLTLARRCDIVFRGRAALRSLVLSRGGAHVPRQTENEGRILGSRFPTERPWHRQPELVFGELLSRPERIRKLYFTGGEPFINPCVKEMLEHLIEKQYARNVELQFNSNCAALPESLIEKLAAFRRVSVGASLDAYGARHEYMRFPAKWTDTELSLTKLLRLPNVSLYAVPIIQIYNALYLPELLEYLDSRGVRCIPHSLNEPRHLRISNLPQSVLDAAAEHIARYAVKFPHNKGMALRVAHRIAATRSLYSPENFDAFMEFTWDLDRSRNQSFRTALPELAELLEREGADLSERHRHYRGVQAESQARLIDAARAEKAAISAAMPRGSDRNYNCQ